MLPIFQQSNLIYKCQCRCNATYIGVFDGVLWELFFWGVRLGLGGLLCVFNSEAFSVITFWYLEGSICVLRY